MGGGGFYILPFFAFTVKPDLRSWYSRFMFNTIPGRLAVYTSILAFDVACWWGILHVVGVL